MREIIAGDWLFFNAYYIQSDVYMWLDLMDVLNIGLYKILSLPKWSPLKEGSFLFGISIISPMRSHEIYTFWGLQNEKLLIEISTWGLHFSWDLLRKKVRIFEVSVWDSYHFSNEISWNLHFGRETILAISCPKITAKTWESRICLDVVKFFLILIK